MKEIFEIAGAIILSLGGGGAIVWALSSWLGKVWANRILESERAKHAKDLEHYRAELDKELKRVGSIQDKALYISKSLFDNEYRIYSEIWDVLHSCLSNLHKLKSYAFDDIPDLENIYHSYSDMCEEFGMLIDKYAPFYQESFYDDFIYMKGKFIFFRNYFAPYLAPNKKHYEPTEIRIENSIEEIKKMEQTLQKQIREYLSSLQLRE